MCRFGDSSFSAPARRAGDSFRCARRKTSKRISRAPERLRRESPARLKDGDLLRSLWVARGTLFEVFQARGGVLFEVFEARGILFGFFEARGGFSSTVDVLKMVHGKMRVLDPKASVFLEKIVHG